MVYLGCSWTHNGCTHINQLIMGSTVSPVNTAVVELTIPRHHIHFAFVYITITLGWCAKEGQQRQSVQKGITLGQGENRCDRGSG